MSNRERQLEELEKFVQELREEGENDLRVVIHVIRSMKRNENYTLKEDKNE